MRAFRLTSCLTPFNSYRVDGYLAENAANLKAQHDALTDALADAEIPVVNATAGMFVCG